MMIKSCIRSVARMPWQSNEALKVQACAVSTRRIKNLEKFDRIRMKKRMVDPEPDNKLSIEEYVKTIDTTLTPEQQAYVAQVKKKFYGSSKQRSLYRDVPRVDELGQANMYSPMIAENANALIDWAFSHVPKREGPRRSKHKKRMKAKSRLVRTRHEIRIKLKKRALARKKALNDRQKSMIAEFIAKGKEAAVKYEEKRQQRLASVQGIVQERVKQAIAARK